MDLGEPLIGDVSILDLILFFAVLFVTGVLAKGLYAVMRRYLDTAVTRTTSKKISKLAQYMVIAVGLYLGFWEILALDFSALIVSLGIVGLAVALASQQIIQNAFAGIIISINRPIEVEDWVEVGGLPATGLCRVRDVTLMNTVMRDVDGRMIYVPNSFITSNKLVNYTKGGFVALNLPVWVVPPAAGFDKIKQIVLQEADRNDYILPKVKEQERPALAKALQKGYLKALLGPRLDMSVFDPQVTVAEVLANRTRLNVKVWIRDINMRDQIVSQFMEALRTRFQSEGIQFAS
jgi:small-conductance mechanosensitive channel